MGAATFSWSFWCAFLLVSLQFKNIESGIPTVLRRLTREIYPEIESDNYGSLGEGKVCVLGDVVYAADEVVPAEQPCLRCKCQPPGVHCETIKCAKKTGCKTVHHPNKCCPDYQCECYHEDRIYANGERLKTSPGDCKVCYCRGGEIQCTEVSCYVRSDCDGKHVEGQCCPKYDHCPLRESTSKSTNVAKESEKNTNVAEMKNATEIDVLSEESRDLVGGGENNLQTESELVLETQQPPSVLKIGDKLLFLKKGATEISTPVITIIGAEGLQIGFEESEEFQKNSTQNSLFNNSNDLEPKVAESTHILSLVKHKKRPANEEKKEVESTTVLEKENQEEVTISSNFVSSTTTEASILSSTEFLVLEETTRRSFEENETTTMTTEEEKEEERTSTDSVLSSTDYDRSVESIEDTSEESGENTTPRNNYASVSTDTVSMETNETDFESQDMVYSFNSSEIDKTNENKTNNQDDFSSFIEEVEFVDRNETLTKPSEKRKRESSLEDEVFRQLELELNVENTEKTQSDEEEKEEAKKIFQQLIDETSTTKSVKKNDKDSETVEKITDAIARFAFGGRKDGGNILGMLSNFFNFQHRFGGKK